MVAAIRPPMVDARRSVETRLLVGTSTFFALLLVAPWPLWMAALVVTAAVLLSSLRTVTASPLLPAASQLLMVSLVFVAVSVAGFAVNPVTLQGVKLIAQFTVFPLAAAIALFGARSDKVITGVWIGVTIGAGSSAVLALLQIVVMDVPRAEGIVGNAIVFGDVALLMGALSFALYPIAQRDLADVLSSRGALMIAAAAAFSGVVTSVLSGSRGGWLAVPVMVALIAAHHRDRLVDVRSRRLLGPVVATVGVVAVAAVLSRGMPVQRLGDALSDLTRYVGAAPKSADAGTTVGARLEAWRSAIDAFGREPVLGVGWGNLQGEFSADVMANERHHRIATFTHAHNQVLGAMASGGLLGVGALAALLAVPAVHFRRAWRSVDERQRALGLAGLLTVGSFAIYGFTESILENLVPVAFYAVVVAAFCSQLDVEAAPRSRSIRGRSGPSRVRYVQYEPATTLASHLARLR